MKKKWMLGLVLLSGCCLAQSIVSTAGNFAVNEKGAATYEVQIRIPPGTAGVEPKLALSYNSVAGNGLLGLGWGISGLSSISRCARTMAQDGVRGTVNLDANDRFCLDGQRLILTGGNYGGSGAEYRIEQDNFSKIISNGTAGNGPASFKVWTKTGLVLEYGTTTNSAIEAQGKTSVMVWAINRVSDAKGNYYTISYTEDQTNGAYYPNRIDYSGNSNIGTVASNSVQFVYESRPDAIPIYQFGSLSKLTQRLSKIQINTSSGLLEEIKLSYRASGAAQPSQLAQVVECAADGACLQPTVITYPDVKDDGKYTYGVNNTPVSSGYANAWQMVPADVNGDGKADMVAWYLNSVSNDGLRIQAFISNGDGTYTNGPLNVPATSGYGDWVMYPADVNGDGKVDMVAYSLGPNMGSSSTKFQAFISNGDGTYQVGPVTTHTTSNLTGWWWMVPADVNGDGKTDMIAYHVDGWSNDGIRFQAFFSNGDGTYTRGSLVTPATTGYVDNWSVVPADINGDGKSDLVAYAVGNSVADVAIKIQTFVSNGDGTFTSGPLLYPATFGDFDPPWKVVLADINGDGKTDLVAYWSLALYGTAVTAFTSKGDGNFVRGPKVPLANNFWGAPLFPADVNGDGKTDLVAGNISGVTGFPVGVGFQAFLSAGDGAYAVGPWYSPVRDGERAYWDMVPADVNGDGRADLVAFYLATNSGGNDGIKIQAFFPQYQTGLVKSISIPGMSTVAAVFKPLTDGTVYEKGTNAVYPVQDLQGPHYVVSATSFSNGIGGTTTNSYRYGGLKKELGTGRGLLGFAWQEMTQTETGLVTRTEFRQDSPYTGLPSRLAISKPGAGNGGLLKETTNSYSCFDPVSDTGAFCTVAAGKRYFPFVSQRIDKAWDQDGSALPVVVTTTTYDCGTAPYACYGNAVTVTVANSDGSSKATTNTYYNDTTNWLLGRLIRSITVSSAP